MLVSGLGAELAHIVHHALHGVDRGAGHNAVAQVEDVTGTSSGLNEDLAHALAEQVFAGEQGYGVEIALNRHGVAEGGPALIEGNSPVKPDDIGAGLPHSRQDGGGVDSEINDGHTQSLYLAHQAGGNGQDEVVVVRGG